MAGKKTNRHGNGSGSLFQRAEGGSWYASWYAGDGKRKERSTRTTSRADAERIMRKWVERSALEREGLVKPEGGTTLDKHAAAALDLHLEALSSSKRAEGRKAKSISDTEGMVRRSAESCGWKTLSDVSPDVMEQYIDRRRHPVGNEAKP